MMRRLSRILMTVVVLLLSATVAQAQDWAKKMFDLTARDFGVVTKGSKTEQVFTVENIYEEDAHVEQIVSSCGCTVATIDKNTLKTWEKAKITATIDTRNFTGRRDATLRVVFDKPFRAEVQLQVHCFIRGDVVVRPDTVQFGTVPLGKSVQKKVSIAYAGRNDWRIERAESSNPNLVARAVETSRGMGQVSYDLTVTLKADAPAGYLRDHVFLVTNDFNAQAARVPVPVDGAVAAALTVRPLPVMMAEPGQAVPRNLVVEGQTPFRITAIECDDPRFKFTAPTEAKTVHAIPVTFTADDKPGKIKATIRIKTDLGNAAPIEVTVQAQIVPKAADSDGDNEQKAVPKPGNSKPSTPKEEG